MSYYYRYKTHILKCADGYDFRYDAENNKVRYIPISNEEMYSYCANADDNGEICGGIIQRNGWQIPEDYPLKF